jgi:hypothetical protein
MLQMRFSIYTTYKPFRGYFFEVRYAELPRKIEMFRFSAILSRVSAVGIATGYELDGRGVRSSSPGREKNFLFSTSSRPALGSTQPPVQWVPGALSPEVKRPGREADHSPRTSAEVKKNVDLYIHSPVRLYDIAHN